MRVKMMMMVVVVMMMMIWAGDQNQKTFDRRGTCGDNGFQRGFLGPVIPLMTYITTAAATERA